MLPGFEAVAEVVFPPLIGLVEVTNLYFVVGFRVLRKPVAKSEVAIETHELPKINVGDARVTSNESDLEIPCCGELGLVAAVLGCGYT